MNRSTGKALGWSIGGLVFAGLLVGGYLIVDHLVRGVIEQKIGDGITAQLPDTVTLDPVVTLGGGSAIMQYLSGSLDTVEVEADPLIVDGARLSAHIEARGVPIDPERPVEDLRATVVIDQAGLNRWTGAAGVPGQVELSDATIGYDGAVTLFGFEIGYHAQAQPMLDGPWIELEPTAATVTTGPLQLDVKQLLGALADQKVRICAAAYLPEGISLTGIRVQPGEAAVQLTGTGLVLARLDAEATGSCG